MVGYHYGAGNHSELKNLFQKSLFLMSGAGIVMTILAELMAVPLVMIFASYDADLFALTVHGFRIYVLSFLVMGVNVWGSAFLLPLEMELFPRQSHFSERLSLKSL